MEATKRVPVSVEPRVPWTLYKKALTQHPIRTKAITSAVLAASGELIAARLRKGGPGDARTQLRRLFAFSVYGLGSGPFYHWWYRVVERWGRSVAQKTDGRHVVTFKVAMDRLLMTPPFLVVTLLSLQWLQTFKLYDSMRHVQRVYKGALMLNWKLWTVAQLINFNWVPVEFRVLFGNAVALVWNMYLSSTQ